MSALSVLMDGCTDPTPDQTFCQLGAGVFGGKAQGPASSSWCVFAVFSLLLSNVVMEVIC